MDELDEWHPHDSMYGCFLRLAYDEAAGRVTCRKDVVGQEDLH